LNIETQRLNREISLISIMQKRFDEEFEKEIKPISQNIANEPLCYHCKGRCIGKLGNGYTNVERAMAIGGKDYKENCELCHGIFYKFDKYYKAAKNLLDTIEYDSFVIGSKYDTEMLYNEESLWQRVNTPWGESIKLEFNREFGKYFSALSGKEGKRDNPDVSIVVDTVFDDVSITIFPVFIYGRYKKYDRNVTQTEWLCKACNGKGCERCNFTGKMYENSVEGYIAKVALPMFMAEGDKFHGMGREDIDVRMLGNGRPFIIEMKSPKKRKVDLKILENNINESSKNVIEVGALKYVSNNMVEKIKNAKVVKEYEAIFTTAAKLEKVKEAINSLKGATICQKTPTRVLGRRADIERKKEVKDIILVDYKGDKYKIKIKAEGGTYIKELIHGDRGRTMPSIASIVGEECNVVELDVVWIYDDV